MIKIAIPRAFASGVISERGEAGLQWLEKLPAKIEQYCALWNLVIDGKPLHGYLGLVVPVSRDKELCVLKITWVDDETRHEALALRLWAGEGAVKLLDSVTEEGVLLLERLDFTKSLAREDIDEAITIAGHLMRRLAIPAPEGLPSQRDYAQRQSKTMHYKWQKLGCPFSENTVNSAIEAAKQLARATDKILVNPDLHYENILAGKREPWLVIDPKVIAGDLEFSVAPLMWNRLPKDVGHTELERRFAMVIENAQLDRHRARCWTLVRSVDYWLWALSLGLTEAPERCREIIEWIVQSD